MSARPRLLLATTTWWPSLAVLASALETHGLDVVMLCPRGHAAFAARHFACRVLDLQRPTASLLQAIEDVAPALVVPGDERAVAGLREIHDGHPHLRGLLEQSLGSPASHGLLLARAPLLEAAASAGFVVPDTRVLRSEADLAAWMSQVPAPWVLKVDGAWGGEGVRITADPRTCLRHFRALRRGEPVGLALRRKLINGDPFPWQARRSRQPVSVSAQAYVVGRPANCAAFALRGRLLGATVVEAVSTCGTSGPSTIVRAVDRQDIVGSVDRLIARHGLSGFLGFDFVMDDTGTASLIEMNPRITTPCRFQGPFGPSPVVAAAKALAALSPRDISPDGRTLFASFPLAWLSDPFRPDLTLCQDDVPWREPGVVRESLRPLWPERGLVAHLPSLLRLFRTALLSQARGDYRQKPFRWWLARRLLGHDPAVPGSAARACPSLEGADWRAFPAGAAMPKGATGEEQSVMTRPDDALAL